MSDYAKITIIAQRPSLPRLLDAITCYGYTNLTSLLVEPYAPHKPEPVSPVQEFTDWHDGQVIAAAKSLFEDSQPDAGHKEYRRGVCELIGRVRLDAIGHGEDTVSNACEVADQIGIADPYYEGSSR